MKYTVKLMDGHERAVGILDLNIVGTVLFGETTQVRKLAEFLFAVEKAVNSHTHLRMHIDEAEEGE